MCGRRRIWALGTGHAAMQYSPRAVRPYDLRTNPYEESEGSMPHATEPGHRFRIVESVGTETSNQAEALTESTVLSVVTVSKDPEVVSSAKCGDPAAVRWTPCWSSTVTVPHLESPSRPPWPSRIRCRPSGGSSRQLRRTRGPCRMLFAVHAAHE